MAINDYEIKSGQKRYRVMIWESGRCLESKSFSRKVDAEAWESKKKAERVSGHLGRIKSPDMTVQEFFEQVYWTGLAVGASTAKEYESIWRVHLLPVFGKRKLNSITTEEWMRFKSRIVESGRSPARANRVHTVASAIYTHAVKVGYSQTNPLTGIGYQREKIKDIKYWSRNEVQAFLEWCKSTEQKLYPLFRFAYESGLRVSEIIALQWDCVDFVQGIVWVRRSYCRANNEMKPTTKSGRSRYVGVNPGLLSLLRSLKSSAPGGLVFCHDDGKKFRYEWIRKWLYRHQKVVGVTQIGVHDIRHTYASHFVMNGGSIYDLKELLGHADVATTMRYAHLTPDHLKAKAALVSFDSNSDAKILKFAD